MARRTAAVVFSIDKPSKPRDAAFRHNLANENHSAPDFVSLATPHIEAKIYFLEISVERDRKEAKELSTQELKSNQTDESLSSKGIHLRAVRNLPPQNVRLDLVIQHHQIPPLSGKKNSP
jgi:hypothetical protein